MKPEIKELFVAALRSGDYIQTTGVLREMPVVRKGQRPWYCIGGVLSELHRKATKRGKWVEGGLTYLVSGKDDPGGNIVHASVLNWAGMKHETLKYKGYDKDWIELNDDGLTFRQLALMIERQW